MNNIAETIGSGADMFCSGAGGRGMQGVFWVSWGSHWDSAALVRVAGKEKDLLVRVAPPCEGGWWARNTTTPLSYKDSPRWPGAQWTGQANRAWEFARQCVQAGQAGRVEDPLPLGIPAHLPTISQKANPTMVTTRQQALAKALSKRTVAIQTMCLPKDVAVPWL